MGRRFPATAASPSPVEPRARRARWSAGLLAGCMVASGLLAACTSAPQATPLSPLMRASPGSGAYEVEPAPSRIMRPPLRGQQAAPAVDPAPVQREECKHLYGPYDTHGYIDPLTGMPALCAVVRCSKCGDIRHECQPRPRR